MTTALYMHDDCLGHITPPGHPEQVARLQVIARALEPLTLDRRLAPLCEDRDILLCHPQRYLDKIAAAVPSEGTVPLDADGMPGVASYYEVKFTDTNKPNGQIWAGVVGTPTTPGTPRGQRAPERWFVVWLGTADNPIPTDQAIALANSIRPWSPPPPPPPPDPNAPPPPPDPNAPPPDPNAPPPPPAPPAVGVPVPIDPATAPEMLPPA